MTEKKRSKPGKGSFGTLQNIAMGLDLFAEQYRMNFNGKGQSSLATAKGVLISFITIFCLTAFGIYRMTFVLDRNGQTLTATVKEDWYTTENSYFSAQQGMEFAVLLQGPIDPSIGEVVIVADSWGYNSENEPFWNVT